MNKLDKPQPNQQGSQQQNTARTPDPSKIMYDALVQIAHSDAFFDGEKRLVKIAQQAIERVTKVQY